MAEKKITAKQLRDLATKQYPRALADEIQRAVEFSTMEAEQGKGSGVFRPVGYLAADLIDELKSRGFKVRRIKREYGDTGNIEIRW